MSALRLRPGYDYAVVCRMVPHAAARFNGPYNQARAHAEATWLREKHPMARVGVYKLVAAPATPDTQEGE